MRVLVVEGWAGQNNAGLGAVRALAGAGHEVDVAHAGPYAVAARSRYVSARHRIPAADDASFADTVRGIFAAGGYRACFPTSDASLVALGSPGSELTDKDHLRARLDAAGVPHAASRTFVTGTELADHAAEIDFPVAVKESARAGSTAGSVWRADDAGDLEAARHLVGPLLVEQWLSGRQRAVSGVVSGGRLLAATHQLYVRTWPIDCGVACAAVTTEPDLALEQQLLTVLGDYEGIFQVQLIDGRVHDVNPRTFGSVSLSVQAGANLPDLAARLADGRTGPARTVRGRPGVHYRWLEGDFRHLRSARRTGDLDLRGLAAAVKPVRGTAHPGFRLADPVPMLARLGFAARRNG